MIGTNIGRYLEEEKNPFKMNIVMTFRSALPLCVDSNILDRVHWTGPQSTPVNSHLTRCVDESG